MAEGARKQEDPDELPPVEGKLKPRPDVLEDAPGEGPWEEPRVMRIPGQKPPKYRFGFGNWMGGAGSGGNVIAAVCSFFIPGLGQLVQGRPLMAFCHFVFASVLWLILLGWVIHLWSIIDAAKFRPGT